MKSYARNRRYIPGGGSTTTLALWQIAQPANRDTVFSMLSQTFIGRKITRKEFEDLADRFKKNKLIWETINGLYIVTPIGAKLANSAVTSSVRDKRRLFLLNRTRKFEVSA